MSVVSRLLSVDCVSILLERDSFSCVWRERINAVAAERFSCKGNSGSLRGLEGNGECSTDFSVKHTLGDAMKCFLILSRRTHCSRRYKKMFGVEIHKSIPACNELPRSISVH